MSQVDEIIEIKDHILKLLDDKKAFDITLIDLKEKSTLASYLIVASGTSVRHVSSLADTLSYDIKHLFQKEVLIEGLNNSNWVILDVKDVIVHIFYPEARSYYQLEKLYTEEI